MKKGRFTGGADIACALRQAESGTKAADICLSSASASRRSTRASGSTAGLAASELRKLKQLEEENRKLKTLVADLTLEMVGTFSEVFAPAS
jgi:putative transposase